MTDVSVIIVNFNTGDFLRACLDSLLRARKATPRIKIETIVVNVTPEDGSGDFIAKKYNWVKQVKTASNDGFSGNNNKALPYATGKYLLFLNPDTVVDRDVLGFLHKKMEADARIGASTCKTVFPDGRLDPDCHRGFPTPWASFCHFTKLAKLFPKSRLFGQYHLTFLDFDKEHEIDALAGAFMLIPREVGERVGFWDEDYFFYGEDIDFCYRIKQGGYKIMYYPQVKITHFKGVASGARKETKKVTTASAETRRKVALASVEAMRLFYEKHWLEEYPRWVTRLVFLGIALLKVYRSFRLIPRRG